MKRHLYIIVFCLIIPLVSCTKSVEEAWGYLDLSVSADVQISEAVKSAETLLENEYQDYTIKLYKNAELQWETSLAEFISDSENRYKRLRAGEYMIYVESCNAVEAAEGFGIPRYAGSQLFVVTAGYTSTVEVVCVMINAKITLACHSGFTDKYVPLGLSVSDSQGRKVALDVQKLASHESAQAIYFNVHESGTEQMKYTLVATDVAANKAMRYDVDFTVHASMWNKVYMTASGLTE